METEIAAKSVGEEVAKLKRWLWMALILIIGLFIACIVLIVIVTIPESDDSDSSSSSSVWEQADESEFDGSDGIAPDCTPGDQMWSADGWYTMDICDGLYAYGDGAYLEMFMVTSSGVIMIDAPPGMAGILPAIVSSVTTNPITTVIYSHHHTDHIGGAGALPNIDSAEIICHRKTNESIVADIPLCTTVLDLTSDNDTYIIQDDDKYVILQYTGYRVHSNNDLIIFAPRQQTVLLIDVIAPGYVPFKNLALSSDPDGYRAVHDYLLDEVTSSIYGDWQHFVGGHVARLGTRADIRMNADYYDDMLLAVEEALVLNETQFAYILATQFPAGFDGTNTWDIFKAYFGAVAGACNDIMIDNGWDTKLNGIQAFGEDNCFTVLFERNIGLSR